MNGLLGLLQGNMGAQTPSTGMQPYQLGQMMGMVPQSQTGLTPQQQQAMVRSQPIYNPTGMNTQQQAQAVGDLTPTSPSLSMEQIMAAMNTVDDTVFQAPDAPQIMNNRGNVLTSRVQPQQSMTSQLMPLMGLMGQS